MKKNVMRAINGIKFELIKMILFFKKFKVKESVLIFSEPRSGSTWLLELLNNTTDSIINFEPLHHNNGVVPKDFNWGNRVFLEKNDQRNIYIEFMKDVLELKYYSKWTIERNYDFLKIIKSKFVLTKFVQGNLLLPWITNRINFKYKPIHLLRHPVAVALSQVKMFESRNMLGAPTSIKNRIFQNHRDYLKGLATPLERQVATWCITNGYILKSKGVNSKWLTIYYEDIIMQTNEELHKVLRSYNLDYNFKLNLTEIRKPSTTTFKNGLKKEPTLQIEKFLREIDNQELIKIQKILDYFEITCYSAFSANPIKD